MAGRRAFRFQLPNYRRKEVAAWFENFNVSFRDPNDFVVKMVDLREDYKVLGQDQTLTPAEISYRKRGTDALWGILQDVSANDLHRHRVDARNIIDEVVARETTDDESLLIPEPVTRPYMGPDLRYPPYPPLDPADEQTMANIEARMPKRQPDDPIPQPIMRLPPLSTKPIPADPSYNDELLPYIPTNLALIQQVRNIILQNQITGFLDPGLLPYKYLDDPGEEVLDMPENCQFLTGPTAPTDPALLDIRYWPALEIYDERGGDNAPLTPSNYIYKLFKWIRWTMAQPEIARKYCIIFRANPRRYGNGSPDELVDEEEPSSEEISAMIGFITKAFPTIILYRQGTSGDPFDDSALGYHQRGRPNLIRVNSQLFDVIENINGNGDNPAATFYILMVTIMHECAHNFLTSTFWPEAVADVHTPRKLRYLLFHSKAEFENHADYDPWQATYGEIGEILEWLLFGFYIECSPQPEPGETEHDIGVICWGSYTSQGPGQIRFGSFAAERMFPSLMRFNNQTLRLFLSQCDQQEREEGARATGLRTRPRPAGQETFLKMGDSTAVSIVDAMDTTVTGTGDDGDEDDAMDIDGGNAATTVIDVDEQLTGHPIGYNSSKTQYRRAIWRIKSEINSKYRDAQGGPIIPKVTYNSYLKPLWQPVVRKSRIVYRYSAAAPFVPRSLPDSIKPWTLMVGIFIYGGIWVWIMMYWESWFPRWLDRLPWFRITHMFCAAVFSLVVFTIPFRVSLKPFGMVRLPRHGYFDWEKTVQNPYNL